MGKTDKGSTGPRIAVTVVPALVIRPGDRVLLNLTPTAYADKAELSKILGALHDRFPGVEFTAIGGVEDMVIEPAAGG